MAENLSEHPAVATPRQVLANGPLIKSTQAFIPSVVLANTGNTGPTRNKEEELLDKLYPGQMANVVIKDMNSNPNKLPKSFNAWTQSSNKIYYNYSLEKNSLEKKPIELARPYILVHEGLHILQFKNNGNKPPNSFEEMLRFEVSAYKQSYGWVQLQIAKKIGNQFIPIEQNFYEQFSPEDLEPLRAETEQVSNKVDQVFQISKERLIGTVDASDAGYNVNPAPDDWSVEKIIFNNMKANDLLPNGDYLVGKLYDQPKR